MRGGTYPSAIVGTPWLGPNLGVHGYYYRPTEKDGIAYTCRGGHIDIAHLRIATDWTAYLATQTYRHLMKHDSGFSYKLAVDRSRDYVQFTYPADWDSLPEARRSQIAQEVSLAVGPYLAYRLTIVARDPHVVRLQVRRSADGVPFRLFLGRFLLQSAGHGGRGTRPAGPGAFLRRGREDLAGQGDGQAGHPTGRRSQKQASESVKGTWSTGDLTMLQTIMKRNFDMGLGDGAVTPSLVPNLPRVSRRRTVLVSGPQP